MGVGVHVRGLGRARAGGHAGTGRLADVHARALVRARADGWARRSVNACMHE